MYFIFLHDLTGRPICKQAAAAQHIQANRNIYSYAVHVHICRTIMYVLCMYVWGVGMFATRSWDGKEGTLPSSVFSFSWVNM
jgi:hypothetical protein